MAAGVLCLLGMAVADVVGLPARAANDLGREDEAIVLLGNADPSLPGTAPDRLAAFRWGSGWTRVPVQVDERAVVDFATIYGDPSPSGFTVLTYTDEGTFTGPDPDPLLDADDEIVLRVRDAGPQAPAAAGAPAGTVPGSGLELAVSNPVSGEVGWLYLFRSDGSLSPLPPSPDVRYDFVLLSGDYKTTYDTAGGGGGNPEASTVSTPSYRVGFTDRWLREDTGIFRGGATGIDLLERHRNRFGPDNCTRTEWTFSQGEGAFIVNKNGPVRALRGYVGANSGVTTFRIHEFYESTERIRTVLRVHEIPGIMDFFDWDAAASGMTWRNDRNPAGVPVDGSPDAVDRGAYLWESISGPQGSLAMVPEIDTDIPAFSWGAWYSDAIPAEASPCSAQGDDDAAYGSSGIWRSDTVPNTDPAVAGDLHRLVLSRTLRYLGPDAPATAGSDLLAEVEQPVTLALSAYEPSTVCADADGDGWAVCVEGCEPPSGVRCGDCDDGDAARNPGAAESCNGIDDDCDGLVDEDLPFETFYRDADGDGYGTDADTVATCDGTPPVGYVRRAGDCDDGDAARNPGAAESCNGIDDDCDGLVDEDLPFETFYRDADGDGYGSPSSTTSTCDATPPDGFVASAGDCDDTDPQTHPGAVEICNGRDDDCDSLVDEDLEGCSGETCGDRDGDGWYACDDGCTPPPGAVCGDCDDDDSTRNPGVTEICNGRDDDCDGVTDGGLPTTTWYADSDGDGFGRDSSTLTTCDSSAPPGFAAASGDCDDANPGVHPGAFEACDGVDNDCSPETADGSSETWLGEACDGDDADFCPTGKAVCSGGERACDDDPRSSVDVCDGLDNDCDGVSDNPPCERFDIDGNGRVDGVELAWVGRAFGSCRLPEETPWWAPVDFDGDGCVDGEDLVILANLWARTCREGILDCR